MTENPDDNRAVLDMYRHVQEQVWVVADFFDTEKDWRQAVNDAAASSARTRTPFIVVDWRGVYHLVQGLSQSQDCFKG